MLPFKIHSDKTCTFTNIDIYISDHRFTMDEREKRTFSSYLVEKRFGMILAYDNRAKSRRPSFLRTLCPAKNVTLGTRVTIRNETQKIMKEAKSPATKILGRMIV